MFACIVAEHVVWSVESLGQELDQRLLLQQKITTDKRNQKKEKMHKKGFHKIAFKTQDSREQVNNGAR
jgi:hypothetical protein